MPTWYDETHLAQALQAVRGVRELAEAAPLTHKEGLAYLEREHGHADDLERSADLPRGSAARASPPRVRSQHSGAAARSASSIPHPQPEA